MAEKINADGGQALAVVTDVTSDSSVADAVSAVSALGRVDLVVNNAGVMIPEGITTADFAGWQRMIDTNVTGVLRILRAFTPDLTAEGHADLVNVSSIGAHIAFPEYAVYGATKAAVTGCVRLCDTMRCTFRHLELRFRHGEVGFAAW